MMQRYSHDIVIDLPVACALPMFTPKGEEAWVPGWQPDYVWPESGEIGEEMIFTTGEGSEKTFWLCLRWQPDQGHVRYHRLTPESRVAFVDVRCRPEGEDRTRVSVGYEILALTDHGRAYLEDLSERAFAEMIDQWADLIKKSA
jgi:hypothetical protein